VTAAVSAALDRLTKKISNGLKLKQRLIEDKD
jgi:hypothetical protein